LIRETVRGSEYDNARILLLIPDLTRTAPVGLVYQTLYGCLADRVKKLDCMAALGTHPPLSQEQLCRCLGLTPGEYASSYSPKTAILNHEWRNPDTFVRIGTIPEDEIRSITGGRLDGEVPVLINRRALEYDQIMIVGSVFPHELAGFSGGNKYFFPGISAGSIIDAFHWLGALITNRKINGCARNPVRELIDRAAAFLPTPVTYFNAVMKDGELYGLYPGRDTGAWLTATKAAERVNIVHTGRSYHRVVCIASAKYDDFWTAAKAVYKAEAVVADGGELIVVAPGVHSFSGTHEEAIRRAGYHPAAWFERYRERYADISGTVLAHLALARCEGSFEGGTFRHRIAVTLASGIDEASCHGVNLRYADHRAIDIGKERERDDTLVIENAGDILYKP
jgi:nickel-dependent lactate racemase